MTLISINNDSHSQPQSYSGSHQMIVGPNSCDYEVTEDETLSEVFPIRLQVDPPDMADTDSTLTLNMATTAASNGEEQAALSKGGVTQDHEEVLGESEDTLLLPTVRRRNLGHDLSSSQRWRLSMNGTPEVFGSICEAQGDADEQPTAAQTETGTKRE